MKMPPEKLKVCWALTYRIRDEHDVIVASCTTPEVAAEIVRRYNAFSKTSAVRCERCGEYLPGHALDGTDICTCYAK